MAAQVLFVCAWLVAGLTEGAGYSAGRHDISDLGALTARHPWPFILAVGLAGALLLTRVLRTLLFAVGTTDPIVFGVIVLLLTTTALLATYLPARRAAKVDPLVTLRYE